MTGGGAGAASLRSLVIPDTPVGPLTLVASPRGLREIRFGASEASRSDRPDPGDAASGHLEIARARVAHALEARVSPSSADADGASESDGAPGSDALPFPALDLEGATPFRRAVWEALLRIPRGELRSYGALATSLGRGSARAVGQAVGANPIPVLIPCHRVVTSGGRLGGFSGGLDRKARLLELEGFRPTGLRFDAALVAEADTAAEGVT